MEELAAVWKTRFNVGFDFATIPSSPVKCCILFDIASEQLAKLNADLERMEKMIPFITCGIFPLSECLRVGVRCQCNGFDFLGPN